MNQRNSEVFSKKSDNINSIFGNKVTICKELAEDWVINGAPKLLSYYSESNENQKIVNDLKAIPKI